MVVYPRIGTTRIYNSNISWISDKMMEKVATMLRIKPATNTFF